MDLQRTRSDRTRALGDPVLLYVSNYYVCGVAHIPCLGSTSLSAHWDTTLEVCVLVGVDRPWILALYTYSTPDQSPTNDRGLTSRVAMILDFFILCACIAGLARTRPSSEHKSLGSWVAGLARFSGQDGLWNLLYSDGVMYFLIAFVANLVPVIFLALSLNRK